MRKVLRLINAPHIFYGWNKTLATRSDKFEEAWLEDGAKRPLSAAELESNRAAAKPPREVKQRRPRGRPRKEAPQVSNDDLIAGFSDEPTADA